MMSKILGHELDAAEVKIEQQVYEHCIRAFVGKVLQYQGKEFSKSVCLEVDEILAASDRKVFNELTTEACFKNIAGLVFVLSKRTEYADPTSKIMLVKGIETDYSRLTVEQILLEFSQISAKELAKGFFEEFKTKLRAKPADWEQICSMVNEVANFSESFFKYTMRLVLEQNLKSGIA